MSHQSETGGMRERADLGRLAPSEIVGSLLAHQSPEDRRSGQRRVLLYRKLASSNPKCGPLNCTLKTDQLAGFSSGLLIPMTSHS